MTSAVTSGRRTGSDTCGAVAAGPMKIPHWSWSAGSYACMAFGLMKEWKLGKIPIPGGSR